MSCRLRPVNRLFGGSPTAIDCQQVTRVSTVPLALVLTAVLAQRDRTDPHFPVRRRFRATGVSCQALVSPRSARGRKFRLLLFSSAQAGRRG